MQPGWKGVSGTQLRVSWEVIKRSGGLCWPSCRSSWNKKYVRISNNQPIFTFGGLVLCGMGINLDANHEFAEYITPRLALPSWSIEIVFKRPDVLFFSDLMFGMFFCIPRAARHRPRSRCIPSVSSMLTAPLRFAASGCHGKQIEGVTSRGLRGCLSYNIVKEQLNSYKYIWSYSSL